MLNKYVLSGLLCLAVQFAFAQEQAQTQDDLLQHYAKQMASVQTLKSNFTEEKHLSLLNQPLQSKGNFSFDKNARQLRWQYEQPFSNGFLIEGEQVYRLQNEEKKPVRQALERMFMAEMLAWLTLDFKTLQKNYKVTLNGFQVTFEPHNPGHKIVKKITVWLDEKEIRRVTQVKMEEPSGDFIVWKFENTQINPPFSGEELK